LKPLLTLDGNDHSLRGPLHRRRSCCNTFPEGFGENGSKNLVMYMFESGLVYILIRVMSSVSTAAMGCEGRVSGVVESLPPVCCQ
jgi:hypothetical protein